MWPGKVRPRFTRLGIPSSDVYDTSITRRCTRITSERTPFMALYCKFLDRPIVSGTSMFQIRSVDQPPPHPTKAYLHHLHCAGMVEMPVEMGFSPHTHVRKTTVLRYLRATPQDPCSRSASQTVSHAQIKPSSPQPPPPPLASPQARAPPQAPAVVARR